MTLLTICQNAADEIGLPQPTAIVASADGTARRLLAIANREGKALTKEVDWTVLQRLHTFTTTASTEGYVLPSDFSRLMRDTEWDRSQFRPLYGPLTPQQYQEIKSGNLGTGIAFRRYRIMRSSSDTTREFRVDPVPATTGDTLAFEYISNQWCSDAAGSTLQSAWAADDDVGLLDEDLMELGIIVRYKRSIGLEFASEANEYAERLGIEKSQDRPSPTLNLAASARLRLISPANIPETGYGI